MHKLPGRRGSGLCEHKVESAKAIAFLCVLRAFVVNKFFKNTFTVSLVSALAPIMGG